MVVAGFNFTKINIERKENVTGKINVSNNISIQKVDKKDISLGKAKQDSLKFAFEFKSAYEPGLGEILITGDVLYLAPEKEMKEILENWKKDKKIPSPVMGEILNTALTKCNIQALILSQELNLPSPIPLPKVEVEKKE